MAGAVAALGQSCGNLGNDLKHKDKHWKQFAIGSLVIDLVSEWECIRRPREYIERTTCATPEQATVAANLEGSKAWHIGQVALRFLIMLPPISNL